MINIRIVQLNFRGDYKKDVIPLKVELDALSNGLKPSVSVCRMFLIQNEEKRIFTDYL